MSKSKKEKTTEEKTAAKGILLFGVTIFLGALLLFLVQPMISKYILPWYGGSPTVWTTCMLFFQTGLLIGYAYAHLLTSRFSPRYQIIIHCTLLLVSLAQLPPVPSESWKPQTGSEPTSGILLMLTATLGLPYILLSATSPLIQRWFVNSSPQSVPYRLYALSNAGSLIALLSFPFLIEPAMARNAQTTLWSFGMIGFVICCAIVGANLWRAGTVPGTATPGKTFSVPMLTRMLWVMFPAAASITLLATTNKLCQEIVVMPLLWVIPLALYLLSFIICFDKPGWYARPVFASLFVVSLLGAIWLLMDENAIPLLPGLIIFPALLFALCMVCHGETMRLKPPPEQLTAYYLYIALGGALGSLFVVIIAPMLFNDYIEYHISIFLTMLLLATAFFTDKKGKLYHGKPRWAWALIVVFILACGFIFQQLRVASQEITITQQRNFYGTIKIEEYNLGGERLNLRAMSHGIILHGTQFMDSEVRRIPTTYYSQESGLGYTMQYFPKTESLRIGAIGLGVGTVATWIDSGDYLRMYEINPDVIALAKEYFYYLNDCYGAYDIVLGDARLSLEQEPPQGFDIIVLDAFNSDSPPIHLLTNEAFQLYFKHLAEGGAIAIHISSKHLDFYPALAAMAKHHSIQIRLIQDANPEDEIYRMKSSWVVMTTNEELLNTPEVMNVSKTYPETNFPVWTDDNSSIFPIFIW